MNAELKLVAVVGNPKPMSRTMQVAVEVMTQVARAKHASSGVGVVAEYIDLAEHAGGMFDPEDCTIQEWVRRAREADVLIVASPTYKATYTGLLKAFVDRFPPDALAGHVAIPLMVGAASIHALAVETHLRPLLVEVGASCPTRGLFIRESEIPDLPTVVGKWMEAAAPSLGVTLVPA